MPWDKYRGKKRCTTCGVPLLICPQCVARGVEKTALCLLCKQDVALGRKSFDKRKHKQEVQRNSLIAPTWSSEAGDTRHASLRSLGSGVTSSEEPSAKKIKLDKKTCGVCCEAFKSRNALFRHINETGHQNRRSKK